MCVCDIQTIMIYIKCVYIYIVCVGGYTVYMEIYGRLQMSRGITLVYSCTGIVAAVVCQ